MREIIYVFWVDVDRRQAGILATDGRNTFGQDACYDDLWQDFARGEVTRSQFFADIEGQAMVIIEGGEHRCTTNAL